MQDDSLAGSRKTAVPEVRLDARITPAVDHRLRMLALARRQSLSHVLSVLLDAALPPADELADALRDAAGAAS